MDLLNRFISHIEGLYPAIRHHSLLLAVSGGQDSVVLAELCRRAGFDFSMAHCNFQLRGEESNRDEAFVQALGQRYAVETYIRQFDTAGYAKQHGLSVQEAARAQRYQWFDALMNESGRSGTLLLTAHHADDNIETLLMHFFRGTGLNGLGAIPPRNGSVIRPLLPFFRSELEDFAKTAGLEWVEDASNASVKYTRNYFRLELIPALEKVFPQVKHNLQDNILRFRETAGLYDLMVEQLLAKLVRKVQEEWHIPVKQLLAYRNRALIYALISRFGFREKQVDELIKLGSSQSGHYIDAPDAPYRIIRHRHWFIISPVRPEASGNIVITENDKEIRFPGGLLQLDILRGDYDSSRVDEQYLDLGQVQFPLLLRKWKAGDYFYPLGMRKKKKIARFLTDLKLSRTEKEDTWVIESAQRIICVAGKRIDDRFKVSGKTRSVLRIQLSPP